MSQEYKIELDTLDHIPADVLGMTVTKLYVDAFTLGPMADDDGNWKKSKNHWAIILEDRSGSCRLSMESRLNSVTGKQGTLVLKKLGYKGQSTATTYRETYTWQWTTVTIRNILLYYIAREWHKFQMHEDSNGAFKGYRHNVETALTAFDRDCAWIQAKSDGGRTISDYLPFVYTMIDDDEGNQELQRSPKAIERGTFLD